MAGGVVKKGEGKSKGKRGLLLISVTVTFGRLKTPRPSEPCRDFDLWPISKGEASHWTRIHTRGKERRSLGLTVS
jgi:hypothetical protein